MAGFNSIALNKARKSKGQRKCRRKTTLMKKASEYSNMCDADVCVGIRFRETGQVYVLTVDKSGVWAFLASHLSAYYPTPRFMTDQDLEKAIEGTAAAK
ncbi:hypothetical protein N7490_003100 [Penicillium lividum]|nr:hypothetical protein N7490_003100 [Penicillium lividum]